MEKRDIQAVGAPSIPEIKADENGIEEAFFLRSDGSPHKKQRLVGDTVSQNSKSDENPPLLQLDLRFDSLRVFLENC